MLLSEIAEIIVASYPACRIAKDVVHGCREESYETSLIDILMDFFSFEIINMCGCGSPSDTNNMIRKILIIHSEFHDKKINYKTVDERYKKDLDLDINNENHYGVLQFILYMLDSCEILAHGSSINSAWLTELGQMYLTVLNAWYNYYYESEE